MYVQVKNAAVISGPSQLPNTIALGDGSVLTNPASLQPSELRELGWYAVTDESLPVDKRYYAEVSSSYTVRPLDVQLVVVYALIDLQAYARKQVASAYQRTKELLDAQAEGYSQAEIAMWPAIQADVIAYSLDESVGPSLQASVDTSAYTVAELAAMLAPRIALQIAVLANRKAMVEAITLAASTDTTIDAAAAHKAVAAINLNTGW